MQSTSVQDIRKIRNLQIFHFFYEVYVVNHPQRHKITMFINFENAQNYAKEEIDRIAHHPSFEPNEYKQIFIIRYPSVLKYWMQKIKKFFGL